MVCTFPKLEDFLIKNWEYSFDLVILLLNLSHTFRCFHSIHSTIYLADIPEKNTSTVKPSCTISSIKKVASIFVLFLLGKGTSFELVWQTCYCLFSLSFFFFCCGNKFPRKVFVCVLIFFLLLLLWFFSS